MCVCVCVCVFMDAWDLYVSLFNHRKDDNSRRFESLRSSLSILWRSEQTDQTNTQNTAIKDNSPRILV